MASWGRWLSLLGVLATLCYARAGMPLQCYKCKSVILTADDIPGPGEEFDEDCDRAALTSVAVLNSGCCRDDEYCGAAQANAKINGMDVRLTSRTCFPKKEECGSETEAMAILLADFPVATDFSDATLCFCNSNFCSPVDCPGSYVKTFDYCLHYGIILALVIGLLLALAMVTGCFFCCCCGCKCCKSKGE